MNRYKEKMHYLIDIPSRNNGVYVILNIPKKKAYVGLAQNMLNRTQDHFLALCNPDVFGKKENRNLIEEKEKQFLHFAIYQENTLIDNTDLQILESIYIYILRDRFGFEMYNKSKNNIAESDIKNAKYSKINYAAQIDVLQKSFEDKFLSETGVYIREICCLSYSKNRDTLEKTWTNIINGYPKANRFCLTCNKDNHYFYEDRKNFKNVLEKMSTFVISKKILESVGVNWGEKSILDEYINLDHVIISNFGAHNGELPYEILKKMDMGLKYSSDKCVYWALKNIEAEKYRNLIDNNVANGETATILLKTTISDNSGGEKVVKQLDVVVTETEIIQKRDKLYETNMSDLIHSYKDDKGIWKPISNNPIYTTIPTYAQKEGLGYKAVAFKIKKFYLCKEYFSFDSLRKIQSPQSTYVQEINREELCSLIQNNENTTHTQYLFAELEKPYVVEVSNTPSLEMYLRGIFDGCNIRRVMLATTGIDSTSRLNKAFAFCEEELQPKVYVADVEDGNTYNDISDMTDEDLFQRIKEGGTRGSYSLSNQRTEEIINIILENGEQLKVCLSRDLIKQPRAINHSDYKYYCFQDSKNKKQVYAFRHPQTYHIDLFTENGIRYHVKDYKRNPEYPLFVLDEYTKVSYEKLFNKMKECNIEFDELMIKTKCGEDIKNKINKNELIGWKFLESISTALECKIEDIMEYQDISG